MNAGEGEPQPSERLDSLIGEYFDRKAAGEGLTPEAFAAEHPEMADELRPYLKGLSLLARLAPVSDERPAQPGAEDAEPDRAEPPRIAGYELLEEIGRGGMGVVYKALQVSTKRVVALKIMLAGPFAPASARRRFEREVELAARLQHPAIVRVLESGEAGGQRYYAMDYVAGVPLDQHLSASEPDLRATLNLFAQICEAVEYAHHHGVVHRDLKPGNVLIDDEGSPHVLDFGLAKAIDQPESKDALTTCVSLPGQVLGTLFYLSPEQAAGRSDEIDVRTDVYALGVMLFEALTGSLPFNSAGRPSEVIQRILEAAPKRPSALSDRVDGELETIILKALQKEPARRYQSAREMGEDIGRYLEGEPILAKRPSSLYYLRKKLRKHRWRVGLAAAVVVLAAAALVIRVAESRSRQRALAAARQLALQYQRALEGGGDVLANSRAVCESHPALPEAHLVFAQAGYRRADSRDEAILFLERRLEQDLSRWPCRALLAEIHRATGDTGRADELAAQAQRQAPDTAEAWYLRSFATLDMKRALQCAREAVRRDPSHLLGWNRLAWLCLETGDLDGALQVADKLIEFGEDSASWTVFKGRALASRGRYREAIDQYTRVARGKSRLVGSACMYRAHAYRGLRDYERALADYDRVLERYEPTRNVWDLYQRPTPLWILGRTDRALEDYRQIRSLLGRPYYSDARHFILLRELGRVGEAEKLLQAALRDVQEPWLRQIFRCLAGQLAPGELVAEAVARNDREHICEAQYYAGEVCLLAGRRAEARKWFEQCVQTNLEHDPDTTPATPMNEYELAEWRLETISAFDTPAEEPAGAPTSRPEKN